MVRSLTVEDRWRLVHALLRITGIRRRDKRDLFIELLEDELRHPLLIKRDEQDLFDVWHLVDACLAYPGAIHRLVTMLEDFQGGSVAVLEIRRLVEDLVPEPLLPPRLRRDLHRLVQELDNGALGALHRARTGDLFRNAVGRLGPVLIGDAGDLRSMLAQLEDLTSGVDGVPPLLTFVEDLAACASEPTASRLRVWAESLADRLELEPGAVQRIRRQALHAARSGQPHTNLVIELRSDPMAPDRFFSSVWLQFDAGPGVTLHRDDDHPLPLDGLPGLIAGFLVDHRVVSRPSPEEAELVIELVVPRSLLCTAFDQFRVTIEGLERRLGIDHPVVVRSFERLQSRVLHPKWRRKWNWLRKHPAEARMHLIPRRTASGGENLYNTLVLEESSVCVTMPFPPAVETDEPADELWTVIHAGVPVVAWSRRSRSPERFAAEFQELLDQGVMALPETVLALRRRAVQEQDAADGDHLGFDLTLMFDDADRLPEPYVRLSAPA